MDPKACLDRAEDALQDGDREECREALSDYRNWRARGGFEPEGGDARAAQIRSNLRAVN